MKLREITFKNGFIIDIYLEFDIGLMIGANMVGERFYFGFSLPFIHVDFSYPIKNKPCKQTN
ncbi:hypothetical protein KDU71_07545 [Carboxylicivirga sediminis]|uniref:Uncharacterized protein n=1 Tax=Carboxylicivirga sediminis TaxID=2006564 RepID=A0A941IWQ2_9BACT|nr:hypothetical protein [Carboxylicivirga sediminis]MBR8535410.1 hypothetical protein [Carboxylicivirga sediminis]